MTAYAVLPQQRQYVAGKVDFGGWLSRAQSRKERYTERRLGDGGFPHIAPLSTECHGECFGLSDSCDTTLECGEEQYPKRELGRAYRLISGLLRATWASVQLPSGPRR